MAGTQQILCPFPSKLECHARAASFTGIKEEEKSACAKQGKGAKGCGGEERSGGVGWGESGEKER